MSNRTQSIVFAGTVCGAATALFSLIPVLGGCLCCLTYIGAGVMAIWHYSSTNEGIVMTSGEGAGAGAMAGIVAAIAASILGYLFLSMGFGPDVEEALSQLYDSGQFDEEQLEMMEGIMNSPLVYVGSALFSMIFGAILGAVGGAIGVSWFSKQRL